MTNRTYYTLCLWDTQLQGWFDYFGDYKKSEVKAESDCVYCPRGHKFIIKHMDSAGAMIEARDTLVPPRNPKAQ